MIDWNLLNKLEGKELAADNVTKNTVGPLTLFKYTNGCHIKGRWNEHNIEARGIIFNTLTGQIVCRPMSKFFNLGERPDTSIERLPDCSYIVYEKLDGSCGNAYLSDGQIMIATPGSMESDQAIWATEWLRLHLEYEYNTQPFKLELEKCTPVFEIIWPDNPGSNVVNYGDRTELVLLTIRMHTGQEIMPHMVDAFAEKYGFSRPLTYNHVLSNDMDDTIRKNEEGYVIYYPTVGMRVKVKSSLYKMLHKMLNQISPKGIVDLIMGREYRHLQDTLEKNCPDMAKQADDIAAALRRKFWDLKFLAKDIYESAICIEYRDRRRHASNRLHIFKKTHHKMFGVWYLLCSMKSITMNLLGV